MAVKASAQITMTDVTDIDSTCRYYLLQSSTLSKPSKPTTNPPSSSWTKTEPSYTAGSTNSLYFTDLTVYSNGEFSYSDVSLSSSYEAAKAAYNKALAAQNAANSAQDTANTALSQGVEYIVGTQTASTNAWTGKTTSASLYTGKTIAYKLPYAGTSSAATLKLTLADGTKTGAIGIRRITSTVTTTYAAGSVITMTYDGTYWRLADYDSNSYDRIKYAQAVKCGSSNIATKNIIVGANGVYKHLKSGSAFDVSYPILYASADITIDGTSTNTYLCIPFVVATTQSLTLTAYKPVYIKGTLNGKMFTPVSTAPLTQTEPTSEDGYYYILLGTAYSTTSMYLISDHPIYKYFNGGFKTVQQIAVEAAQTATNYISYDSTNGLQVGNKTSGSWSGFRTQITSSAFNILNAAGETLASYGAKLIELGKNASDAVIKFCNGKGQIGINVENELELSSDRIRMSSINDSMNSASVSSHVNRESDGYYINPSIGTSAHYDATGTYSSRANGYASMTAGVSTDAVQNTAEIGAYATENGTSVRIKADEVLVNGVDVNKKLVYSTEEQAVGRWINGKSLYRKTISCGALPNNGTTRVYHGIDAIETLVEISGTATNGNMVLPLPCVATASAANNINVYIEKYVDGRINIQTGIDRSTYTESYVTLTYTKVQD